jgi:hypothetical protein
MKLSVTVKYPNSQIIKFWKKRWKVSTIKNDSNIFGCPIFYCFTWILTQYKNHENTLLEEGKCCKVFAKIKQGCRVFGKNKSFLLAETFCESVKDENTKKRAPLASQQIIISMKQRIELLCTSNSNYICWGAVSFWCIRSGSDSG